MYEQQDNRDRDQKMMFQMQGIPTNQVNMSKLPKWIRYFGYFFYAWIGLFSIIAFLYLLFL
ncbi:hypothetical protein [Bacillus wiedmannii]|uniref:hypothetical protein n=1 Tax=Bacillus wiedmannii TaxID=1890302 RepID=UPI000BEFFEC4|nr:hypothetical protein [Bacillus wiedmannii]PEJ67984.1 hypothetical protein CN685_20135 [Bacillus wiedmannii]